MSAEAGAPRLKAWGFEGAFVRAIEILAATILVAEIFILFVGVVARYAVGVPLTWSDELASILFVWLTMLGTAIAFQRDQHMRMTALSSRVRPALRAVLEIAGLAAPIAFLLVIGYPALEYALEERVIVTPALEISNAWRSSALPAGLALMLVFAACRIVRERLYKPMLVALVIVAAFAGVLFLAKPLFMQLGNWNLLIFFVGFIAVGVALGVPIGGRRHCRKNDHG